MEEKIVRKKWQWKWTKRKTWALIISGSVAVVLLIAGSLISNHFSCNAPRGFVTVWNENAILKSTGEPVHIAHAIISNGEDVSGLWLFAMPKCASLDKALKNITNKNVSILGQDVYLAAGAVAPNAPLAAVP